MRTILFFVGLVTIIGLGWSSRYIKQTQLKGEIIHYSEWPLLVQGKWEIKCIIEIPEARIVQKGVILFNKDNSYLLHSSNDVFIQNPNYPDKYLDGSVQFYGGSITGQYSFIDDSILALEAITCDITNHATYTFVDTSNCYGWGNSDYGNYNSKSASVEIIEFNKEKISFAFQDYSRNEKGVITFIKSD